MRFTAIFFALIVFCLPLSALATDSTATTTTTYSGTSCECFCGSKTAGATDMKVAASAVACSTECAASTTAPVVYGQTGAPTWGKQNEFCSPTKSGTPMGYCYAQGIPVNLNVPIAGNTSVSGLSEYIPLIYNYLIPAASLVAVVMLMVGGLQYATARGNTKAVDQGKTRIANALIGLVLLLSAYAISSRSSSKLFCLIREVPVRRWLTTVMILVQIQVLGCAAQRGQSRVPIM